ncbi:MAG: hypothetical protein E2O68_00790 [Deltaproteobacteria bacterium]|nr:MAG: hypothetical protein E2O68_00790 [Deltaproteobacteria bacterium]
MASAILTLPPRGNFRVRSKCRLKTAQEKKRGLCRQWNTVLQIQAVIDLPNIGQWTWRNQCFNNPKACNHAAEIWRELNHQKLSFHAICGPFKRNFWKMPDNEMRKRGIFICGGSKDIQLKIRAKRVR